ncbi:zinc finger protein ZFP2 [Astyanax mexicanus]|uniref:zinc finger protein ZFP2 n=1 Tax=Astyanax mexicanus TaxID=7994 RepID=UPI0020CAE3F5|nr:zinc finger protein ZFP2 [Astyanax mexicanus]
MALGLGQRAREEEMEFQDIRPSSSSGDHQNDLDSLLVVIKTEPDHDEGIGSFVEDHHDLQLPGNAFSPSPSIPKESWDWLSERGSRYTLEKEEDEQEDIRSSLVVIKVEPDEEEPCSSGDQCDVHHELDMMSEMMVPRVGTSEQDLQEMPFTSYSDEDPEHENSRTFPIVNNDLNTTGEDIQPSFGQPKEPRSYCCSYCGRTFSKSSPFYSHMRIHTGERPFQCTHCDKSFIQSTTFKIHQRIHTGERPYQCSECGKTFKRLDNLRIHQRTHTGEKPYKCSHCPKTFSRLDILQNHERIHTGEKPFLCSYCSKTFSRMCIFQVHLRTHTGERPYQCMVCEKRFVELSNLKNHERIHTQERPYQCSLCDKNFIQLSGLTGHMRKHTGEKPYQCTICGNRYSASSTLHDHRRKKHMPSSTTSTVLLSEPTVLQQLETHDEVVSMRYNDLNMIPIPLETGTGIDSSTSTLGLL